MDKQRTYTGRPALPEEEKRRTTSLRIRPIVWNYLKKHRLSAGKVLDEAVMKMMEEDDL